MPKCIHCGVNRYKRNMIAFDNECIDCRTKLDRKIERIRVKYSARYRREKREQKKST